MIAIILPELIGTFIYHTKFAFGALLRQQQVKDICLCFCRPHFSLLPPQASRGLFLESPPRGAWKYSLSKNVAFVNFKNISIVQD